MISSPVHLKFHCNGCLKEFKITVPVTIPIHNDYVLDAKRVKLKLSELDVETCEGDVHWCEDCRAGDPPCF